MMSFPKLICNHDKSNACHVNKLLMDYFILSEVGNIPATATQRECEVARVVTDQQIVINALETK
jgi:hypothetical protein